MGSPVKPTQADTVRVWNYLNSEVGKNQYLHDGAYLTAEVLKNLADQSSQTEENEIKEGCQYIVLDPNMPFIPDDWRSYTWHRITSFKFQRMNVKALNRIIESFDKSNAGSKVVVTSKPKGMALENSQISDPATLRSMFADPKERDLAKYVAVLIDHVGETPDNTFPLHLIDVGYKKRTQTKTKKDAKHDDIGDGEPLFLEFAHVRIPLDPVVMANVLPREEQPEMMNDIPARLNTPINSPGSSQSNQDNALTGFLSNAWTVVSSVAENVAENVVDLAGNAIEAVEETLDPGPQLTPRFVRKNASPERDQADVVIQSPAGPVKTTEKPWYKTPAGIAGLTVLTVGAGAGLGYGIYKMSKSKRSSDKTKGKKGKKGRSKSK